jgi:hypothetical protein
MAADRLTRLAGVVLMAGAPAVFWAYAAKVVFALFGVTLAASTLAIVVGSVFLFLSCVVAGLALRN